MVGDAKAENESWDLNMATQTMIRESLNVDDYPEKIIAAWRQENDELRRENYNLHRRLIDALILVDQKEYRIKELERA